ncbi:BCCT family transporter [Solicola sp. PLA-1-18]|uniref:BCCT family transporter n=1 Tax=Solicola sp. PLA-1-18 TaxID=3380532 RepID=UPI003B7A9D59
MSPDEKRVELKERARRALAFRTRDEVDAAASRHKHHLDWVVFGITGAIAIAFVVWGAVSTTSLGNTASTTQGWIITNTGWFFVLAASFFVIFVIWLAASKYGKIPLGADDEKPEFNTVSWIAMMFSAGMGIGLMFYSVAEPLGHYIAPPPGTVEGDTDAAVETAMATTMFHWALHPWAIYAVVGVAIAYGTFRKGRSQLISSAFTPLFGERATNGPGGRVIDILAIFATLFGSAASLGLGALQIGSGLVFNGWVDSISEIALVSIIVVLTICFIVSAVSGIERGIQWLSNTNMVLALVLAVFVFVVGPTLLTLNLLPTALGDYLTQMGSMASRTAATGDEAMATWLSSWTIFYWAWWVSWTPFVGMFIARISRGRTIRSFVTGVLLVPSMVSLVWFAIFGGAGIQAYRDDAGSMLVDGAVSTDGALFQLLSNYPLASISTVLVMVLVGIFFVSGADAASIVMGTLSERGNTEPGKGTVIFWGVLTGAVAAIMLVIGGGGADALTGLQNITIAASLPFVLVMLLLCLALYKDLQTDPMILRGRIGEQLVEGAVVHGVTHHEDDEFVLVTEVDSEGRAVDAPGGGASPAQERVNAKK